MFLRYGRFTGNISNAKQTFNQYWYFSGNMSSECNICTISDLNVTNISLLREIGRKEIKFRTLLIKCKNHKIIELSCTKHKLNHINYYFYKLRSFNYILIIIYTSVNLC